MALGLNGATWSAHPSNDPSKDRIQVSSRNLDFLEGMDLDRSEYIEFILDHFNNPRNQGPLDDPDILVNGGNPGCGDVVTMYVKVDDDNRVSTVQFEGRGCTISMAGASIITEMVTGKTLHEIEEMHYAPLIDQMGQDVVKSRLRCATLGIDTLKGAAREYPSRKATGQKLIQPIVLAHTLATD
jgi:nitrogen fixation NifU-like protein